MSSFRVWGIILLLLWIWKNFRLAPSPLQPYVACGAHNCVSQYPLVKSRILSFPVYFSKSQHPLSSSVFPQSCRMCQKARYPKENTSLESLHLVLLLILTLIRLSLNVDWIHGQQWLQGCAKVVGNCCCSYISCPCPAVKVGVNKFCNLGHLDLGGQPWSFTPSSIWFELPCNWGFRIDSLNVSCGITRKSGGISAEPLGRRGALCSRGGRAWRNGEEKWSHNNSLTVAVGEEKGAEWGCNFPKVMPAMQHSRGNTWGTPRGRASVSWWNNLYV